MKSGCEQCVGHVDFDDPLAAYPAGNVPVAAGLAESRVSQVRRRRSPRGRAAVAAGLAESRMGLARRRRSEGRTGETAEELVRASCSHR
jgi:hypothetical protein